MGRVGRKVTVQKDNPSEKLVSEVIIKNLLEQKRRVLELGKASLIIIDGGVGEGKTTLATICADILQGRPIIFSEQLGLGGLDFAKKLKECYKKGLVVVIYDEGGDFDRRGAITKFNRFLNRIFEMYRAFKIIVIVCLPVFYALDQSLFDKRIPQGLLHVEHRTLKQGNIRGYDYTNMMYMIHWTKSLPIKSHCYGRTHPNFYAHFKNLPEERAALLDKYTTSGKFNIIEESGISIEGLVSIKDIAGKVGLSVMWVQRYLKGLKVKPEKIYKNRYYFNESIIERIIMVRAK